MSGHDSHHNVPRATLTKHKLRYVVRVLTPVVHEWESIGYFLEITNMKQIKLDYRESSRRLIGVVNAWLEGQYREDSRRPGRNTPSWAKVVETLKAPTGGNNPRAAKEIAERWQTLERVDYSRGNSKLASTAQLTEVEVKWLLSKLRGVSSKWFEIGTLLGIPVDVLTSIQSDDSLKAIQRLRGVIEEWLSGSYDEEYGLPLPSIQVLVEVIEHSAGGKSPALAKTLAECKVYPQPPQNTTTAITNAQMQPCQNEAYGTQLGQQNGRQPLQNVAIGTQPHQNVLCNATQPHNVVDTPQHSQSSQIAAQHRTQSLQTMAPQPQQIAAPHRTQSLQTMAIAQHGTRTPYNMEPQRPPQQYQNPVIAQPVPQPQHTIATAQLHQTLTWHVAQPPQPVSQTTAMTQPPQTTAMTRPPQTTAMTQPPQTTAQPLQTVVMTQPPQTTAQPLQTAVMTQPPQTTAMTQPPQTTAMTQPPQTTAQPLQTAVMTQPPQTTAMTRPPTTTTAPPLRQLQHTSGSLVLTSVGMRHVKEMLADHAYNWGLIGSQLGFTRGELNNHQAMTPQYEGPHGCLSTMLDEWGQWPTHTHPSFPSLEELERALSSKTVRLAVTAVEIQEMFEQLEHGTGVLDNKE